VSNSTRVWCLRHAESENVVGRVAGAQPLAPLTALGRQQAESAADVLAGEPVARVWSSTALRARETATVIANRMGVEVIALPELAEVDIGDREGSVDPAIHAETAEVLRSWVVDGDLSTRVADGEYGSAVVSRVLSALTIATVDDCAASVVVGHVASLTVALSVVCGLGAEVWGAPLPHAVPFLVRCNGSDWSCPSWPTPSR
jgi:broad specificity phosphatase PhoE